MLMIKIKINYITNCKLNISLFYNNRSSRNSMAQPLNKTIAGDRLQLGPSLLREAANRSQL